MPRRVYRRKTKKRAVSETAIKKVVRKEFKNKGLKNVEKNWVTITHDVTLDNDTTWNGLRNTLNLSSQGDGLGQHQGNSVQPLSMELKGIILAGGSTANCRLLFIRWEPASIPSLADILDNPTGVAADQIVNVPYNRTNRKSFKVLWDKSFFITGTYDNAKCAMTFHKRFNLKSHSYCFYSGTTAVEGDISKGKYYLIYMSDVGTGDPIMRYSSTFTYADA